jgi:hypothetical protein
VLEEAQRHSCCHSTRDYLARQECTGWSTRQHAVDDPLLSCKQQKARGVGPNFAGI